MWSQYYLASLSQLLRKSILLLCSENVPFEDKLEIDGIICISTATDQKQIVVKVHEVVENLKDKSVVPDGACSNKSCSTEPEDEEIFTIESQDGQRSTDGDQSDSVDSSHCEISVAVENGTSVEYTVTGPPAGLQHGDADTSEDECHEPLAADHGELLMDRPSRLPCRDIFPSSRRRPVDSHHKRSSGSNANVEQQQEEDLHQEDLATHHGEYLCRLCGSHYPSFSALNAHNYDVHCRFTCRQCLNTFSMMCNLKRHERLHVGRKPYTCAQCGKGFSRNSDLRIHALKLHRHTGIGGRQQGNNFQEGPGLQEHSQHSKRAKSGGLGDILSKLAMKQLQKLRERERRLDEGALTPKSHHGRDDSKLMSVTKSETDENAIEMKQVLAGSESSYMEQVTTKESQAAPIPTPLPTPIFSRSILKPSIHVNSMTKEPKKVIHIYPTCNSSSGGHMEEAPLAKKMKYEPSPVPTCEANGTEQAHYDVSTVHGLSFGRIVFPEQTPSIKTEPQENRSSGEVELGLTSLPFLTYSGHKLCTDDMQRAGERSETPSPVPPVLISSASSSPTRARTPPVKTLAAKDEQPEQPALIALDRRYWCHLCKTHWENFSSYEQHHVSHHLRYPCQFCDQTFSNKNNRSRHIRSHTGQKEHICPDCGKSFSRSDTLKEHQIIHTDGYLGDQCNYCHVIIKKKAELLSHIKKCTQRQRGRLSASASPTSFADPDPQAASSPHSQPLSLTL